MKKPKNRFHLLTIVVSYFTISCLYIVFSDRLLLYLLGDDSSSAFLYQLQSYKGIAFVLLTAVVLFLVLKKREAIIIESLDELERAQQKINTSLKKVALSEFLLKEASLMAGIGAYEFYIENNSIYFSDEVYSIFEIPKGKEFAIESMRKILKEESNTLLIESANTCMESGVPFDIELELEFVEKPNVWIRVITQPIYDKNKKIIGRRGALQDITIQKKRQKEIDFQNEKLFDLNNALNQGEELSHVGSWLFSPSTKKSQWSLEMFNIWGFNSSMPAPEYSSIVKRIHLDDLELFNRHVENAIHLGTPYDIEFRICLPDGTLKTIRAICKPLLGEGNVINLSGINQDITLQKNKELEYLRSENLLNQTGRLGKIGGWGVDLTTMESYFTEETFRIYGILDGQTPTVEEGMGHYPPESRLVIEKVFEEAMQGKKYDIEVPFVTTKGENIWVRTMGVPTMEKGKAIYVTGIIQDITEQKRIRDKIEEVEEMYRLLANHSNDIICLHETNSTIKYISPSVKTLLGYQPSEFIDKQIFSIIHKDDVQPLKKAIEERVFKGLVTDAFSYRVRHKEGHFIWLESLGAPIIKDEKITSFVTSSRDVTQWVLAKEEIQKNQKSLQKLTTEITLIEEKQKKEIATNIHDHLSQSLVISKMRINELKKRPQLRVIDEDLRFIETHISEALINSRKITYELSPPVLYQLGIVDALNWFLEDVEATHGVKCQLNSNVEIVRLNDGVSILLYRSIQEVLTNVVKYAKASLITLDLNKNKIGVEIVITDNGIGFDTSVLEHYNHIHSSSGLGLFTVKERIRNIQGEFTIASNINVGTTVKIFIPLSI